MATDTATIRVARITRDTLAEQARERGMSLAALLAELAREHEAELAWRSERDAARRDTASRTVALEDGEWEAVLADGL
jgi:predicted DNA-binding ribbon-helix-helix protein